MAGHDETFFNELLNGHEGVAEVFGILDGGDVAADLSESLCKCRASEFQGIEREVDVVEAAFGHVLHDGADNLADIAHLAAGADDDGSRADNLVTVGIFLGHREGVLAGGDIDLQCAAEVAESLYCGVKAGVLALLCATGPHPVGREADAFHTLCQGSPYQVGKAFCYGEHTAGGRVGECSLWCMSDGGGDTALSAVVEGDSTAVGERKLEFALALLAGHTSRNAAVHLVRQPILAGHGFQAEHVFQVFVNVAVGVCCHFVGTFYSHVFHDGLRAGAEHLFYGEVERSYAVGLFEGEAMVAGGFAHGVHGSAFAVGDALHVFDGLFVDEESHAFLALVGNDFLGAECGVADGEFVHMYESAAFLHEFAEAVHVSGTSVVVDGDDGVFVLFAECAYHVVGTFLHFRVGALYGVQFDAAAVASCFYGTYRSSTESDAVVLTAHHHNLVARLGFSLQTVALGSVSHTSGEHDDFVVGVAFVGLFLVVLEGQYGAADEGLSELVSEVGSSVRGLDENLFRSLVEPGSFRQIVFPLLHASFLTGIGGHIYCRSGNGPAADAATHTVADFAAGTRGGTVEGLHGGGEVMGFSLQRDDAFHLLRAEEVGLRMVGR